MLLSYSLFRMWWAKSFSSPDINWGTRNHQKVPRIKGRV
jgi:hypothetical protein